MKQTAIRMLSLLVCVLMLGVPALAEETAETTPAEAPNVTEILNTYTGLDLTPSLGKTVLVNFFTEWCTYCMQEMPDIKAVSELYDEEAFQVVLVHPWDGEDASNTESVKERFGMQDMTFYEDEQGLVSTVVGVPGYPTTLFINPDGTMAAGAAFKLSLQDLTDQLDYMGVPRKADEQ